MSQRTVSIDEARELAKQARGKRWGERRAAERKAQVARRARFRVSTEPVSALLPFPPSLNRYYRRAVVGKHIQTYISKKGDAYRKEVIRIWEKVGVTFGGRLAIKVVVVFPDRREYDLDGLWKALLDALEHAGAYANDSQIKAESMEQEAVEAPGWANIVLGPKPGQRQGTLFDTKW